LTPHPDPEVPLQHPAEEAPTQPPAEEATAPRRFPWWNVAIAAVLGLIFGLGVYTFSYAEGLSYFSDDPTSCVNCHVMRDQYDAWSHSSHKAVAACNDCHTPHHNAVAKYTVKAINGFNHSLHFTLDTFPEPIRIRAMNARVAQENCLGCHESFTSQMHVSPEGEGVDCVACHANVGHGTID
jgi:cytochrome c nitrite reductase small subunit